VLWVVEEWAFFSGRNGEGERDMFYPALAIMASLAVNSRASELVLGLAGVSVRGKDKLVGVGLKFFLHQQLAAFF